MASETTFQIPRIALVEGDPVLGMEAIKKLKHTMLEAGMSPSGWIEMCPPTTQQKLSEFMNSLDGEVSLSDWDGNCKAVVLRGLINNRQFMDILLKVIQGISPTNTLVVFDETGVMRTKGGSWGIFRDTCKKMGSIISVPVPFDELDGGRLKGVNQVRAVVDEVSKRGKKISSQTVREVFLERAIPEWSFILPEIDKLVELSVGVNITPKEVSDIVFPSIPNHAIYEFAIAFNGGILDDIMNSYDDIMASQPSNPRFSEAIVAYAMKLIRWQLITSHLISYGQPLPEALQSLGARMTIEEGRKRMERDMAIHPDWFFKGKTTEQEKKDQKLRKFNGISPFEAKGACSFVKNIFSRRIPVQSGNLKTLPFMRVAMLRYWAMFECMQKIRMCGDDKQVTRQIFRQTIYKICWRG
jgi:hypothetical protein